MKRNGGGWNQEVTDAQGRRRFHGAFTGGFSAGHYNSVGTEDGWQPATFESSRGSRNARAVEQRAEDFMDEEDDPLLGKQLETAETYDTLQHTARQRVKDSMLGEHASSSTAAATRRDMALPLLIPDELVMPTSDDSIGKKLLSQMGWKDGHGIGPKLLRRKLKLDDVIHGHNTENDRKRDGDDVFVPPRSVVTPKLFPTPKLDKYGAGFDPFVDAPEFLRHKQQQQQRHTNNKTSNSTAIATPARQIVTFAQALGGSGSSAGRGAASRVAMGFGLSALEDNDDLDVYGTTSMDEFDRAILPPSESIKMLDSMSSRARDKKRQQEQADSASSSAVLCADGRPALPGFRIASQTEKPPASVNQKLDVPSDFRAFHTFDDQDDNDLTSVSRLYGKFNFSTEKRGRGSLMTARQRAQILQEDDNGVHSAPATSTPPTSSSTRTGGGGGGSSVFDLLDTAQRDKLMGAAQAARERKPLTTGAPSEQFRANVSASIAKRFVSASTTTTEGGSDPTAVTAAAVVASTAKKAYRTEDAWAPHALLCKRFHVKCQGPTISGSGNDDAAGQDLFTKELAPHLVDLAAAGRHATAKGQEADAVVTTSKRRGDHPEDALPPLPVLPKPSTDLLRSIFEPSDGSEIEEDDDEEGEKEAEAEAEEKQEERYANAAAGSSQREAGETALPDRSESGIRDSLTTAPADLPVVKKRHAEDDFSTSSSGNSESSSEDDDAVDGKPRKKAKSTRKSDDWSSKKRKKSKHIKEKDSKKAKKAKKTKKAKKSSASHTGASSSSRSMRRDRGKRGRSESRSRSRDRKRPRDRSRDRK